MPAGDAEDGDANLQAWTGDETELDGPLDAQVRAAAIAHGGYAGVQRLAHVLGRAVEAQREGIVEALHEAAQLEHDVDVGVDEAGQDGLAAGVDFLIGAGRRPMADVPNPLAFDAQPTAPRRRARAIDDRAIVDHRAARHRLPPVFDIFGIVYRLLSPTAYKRAPVWLFLK